jgi:hypothetical protein
MIYLQNSDTIFSTSTYTEKTEISYLFRAARELVNLFLGGFLSVGACMRVWAIALLVFLT